MKKTKSNNNVSLESVILKYNEILSQRGGIPKNNLKLYKKPKNKIKFYDGKKKKNFLMDLKSIEKSKQTYKWSGYLDNGYKSVNDRFAQRDITYYKGKYDYLK